MNAEYNMGVIKKHSSFQNEAACTNFSLFIRFHLSSLNKISEGAAELRPLCCSRHRKAAYFTSPEASCGSSFRLPSFLRRITVS